MSVDYLHAPLVELAKAINAQHYQAIKSHRRSLFFAKGAGEMLLIAKHRIGHGKWTAWLMEHFEGSLQTAWLYMRIASQWSPQLADEIKSHPDLSIRGALSVLRLAGCKASRRTSDNGPDDLREGRRLRGQLIAMRLPAEKVPMLLNCNLRAGQFTFRGEDKPQGGWRLILETIGSDEPASPVTGTKLKDLRPNAAGVIVLNLPDSVAQ